MHLQLWQFEKYSTTSETDSLIPFNDGTIFGNFSSYDHAWLDGFFFAMLSKIVMLALLFDFEDSLVSCSDVTLTDS